MKAVKLILLVVSVFIWGQWIIHVIQDHADVLWQQALVLLAGFAAPVWVVAQDRFSL